MRMSSKLLQFTHTPQAYPTVRTAGERRSDFAEIYEGYSVEGAEVQASRCSQCGVPFCQLGCPLENNIPDWLMLTAAGREKEAYRLAESTNPMPEICGRICPQDRLCEGSCVIEKDFRSVTIGSIEKYLADKAWQEDWVEPITPLADLGMSVGIVGSGPAGLAAAEVLARTGYKVHVYERSDRAGGLLVYGIPSFKLEKDVVARRIKRLEDAGVTFHLGVEVGRTVQLAELRDQHGAVLLATGVYKARALGLPADVAGTEAAPAPSPVQALDYLTASNRLGFGDVVDAYESGALNAAGKSVVVIGGGDTAMDCVRTAVRQGATSVKCLYRRDRESMPGSNREVAHAEAEGVDFVWLRVPKALLGGKTPGLRTLTSRLGVQDAKGQRALEEVPGSEETFEADMIITALGFEPEDLPADMGVPELAVQKWGTVKVHPIRYETSLKGVFAAGDIVRGASLVVWALREGMEAAAEMHRFIQSEVAVAVEGLPAGAEASAKRKMAEAL